MESKNLQVGLGDIVLPIGVVAVVSMMILPLPAFLLDCMLMVNISFAVLLIISVVYLKEPEKFTALPSLLLFATLLRLALNISTTRYILSTGEAPYIVSAFSNFVVQGNIVVGVVIFMIITIVQFLVIAKGAERVAEVSARFSLDAMPGRQMSIDADIRSGILSIPEAKEKRINLQTESKLYAALDGAMRFIKGDAIAGIIITLINITAGIVVGVSMFSIGIAESFSRFTFYTIGDGLVSQIPALLVSVAAGITITRVSDQKGNLVGRDIINQISSEPQAIVLTSIVLMFLSFVPGMPRWLFLFASIFLIFLSYKLKIKQQVIALSKKDIAIFSPKVFSGLSLKISEKAALKISEENKFSLLTQNMRQNIFNEKGVILPDVQYEEYKNDDQVSFVLQLPSLPKIVIFEKELEQRGDKISFSQYIIGRIEKEIINNLIVFIDDSATRYLFEVHAPLSEALINTLVPEKISVTALTRLLRDLVSDGISIREFQVILQAVSEYLYLKEEENSLAVAALNNNEPNVENVSQYVSNISLYSWVRIALKSEVVKNMESNSSFYCLTKDIEEKIEASIYFTKDGAQALRDSMREKLETLLKVKASLILLSSSSIRVVLSECFRDLKNIKFIALEELPVDYELKKVESFNI